MPEEFEYITPSEMDSDSASEWCESESFISWEDHEQNTNLKATGSVPTSPSVPALSFVPDPSLALNPPSIAPAAPPASTVTSTQYQVPNDQDKYPDLPDYMPFMPLCVPRSSPHPSARPAPAAKVQSTPFATGVMSTLIQQQNGPGLSLYPGSFHTSQNYPGAGIKTGSKPGNDNLLMTDTGLGLWFDPSAGAFRLQHFPSSPSEDKESKLDFEAVMPSTPADSELAMDSSPFVTSRDPEPTGDTEHDFSKLKASSNVNASTIPLLCFLCEKTPRFSDVSHLLTHISSKGHLSRRFHLDLKAQTDDDIQQRLLQFDLWFQQHGIQKLLKSRQEAKEQKKRTQVKRQRGSSNMRSRSSFNTRESLKSELDDASLGPVNHLNPLNQQNWQQGVHFDNAYQTPSKQARSLYPVPDSPQELSRQNDEPTETRRQGGSGTPTLKGVIHKGMGIFDAGTPEMKRMRNQRKHPSVLNNMLLVSESIGMTEQVWNGSMTKIEHERNVYDTPTDLSSPVSKDEDEPLPKKSRGPHAATKPTDATSQRLTRSAARAMNRTSSRSSRGGKRGGGKRGGGKRGGGKKITKIEDEDFDSDEELDTRRGKRSLSVFRDDAVDDGARGGDIFGRRPHGANDFDGSSFRGQQGVLPHRPAMHGLPSNRPMSSMYPRPDNHQFVMYDKENDRNAVFMQHTSNMHGYYEPRQSMQSGAFNPLCIQRQDNYANVYGQGFDSFKPSESAFQPMNGMVYGGLPSLINGSNNDLNNDLHNGLSSDMSHGLNHVINEGSQFQPGNSGGQNNGFDIQ